MLEAVARVESISRLSVGLPVAARFQVRAVGRSRLVQKSLKSGFGLAELEVHLVTVSQLHPLALEEVEVVQERSFSHAFLLAIYHPPRRLLSEQVQLVGLEGLQTALEQMLHLMAEIQLLDLLRLQVE